MSESATYGVEFALRHRAPRSIQRTEEREEFLRDLLLVALEHNGYGFFELLPSNAFSLAVAWKDLSADIVIQSDFPEDRVHYIVTPETMARGISVVRNAVTRDGVCYRVDDDNNETDLMCNANNRTRILEASKENDAGQLDVNDALAILECALFGKVVFC